MKFSIVINTYNRAAQLSTCLSSLAFLHGAEFEVIIVNGPSTDNTRSVVEPYVNHIKYLECDIANLSKSRNIGIRAARGDIICFLDDDAYPEPTWLTALTQSYQNPSIGGVGSLLLDHTGRTFQCKYVGCDCFGRSFNAETLNKLHEWVDVDPENRFVSPTGAGASYRLEALLKVGGFDEEFEYFLDETDVNYRMIRAGASLTYNEQAIVYHKYAPSHIRNVNNVPKTRFPTSKNIAYFSLKTALDKGWDVYPALRYIAAHRVATKKYNKGYEVAGTISSDKRKAFDDEVDAGTFYALERIFSLDSPTYLNDNFPPPDAFKFFLKYKRKTLINVAFVCQNYGTAIDSGIAKWIKIVAEGLAARGHIVSVFTVSDVTSETVDLINGVWIHRIRVRDFKESPIISGISLPSSIYNHAKSVYAEITRVANNRGIEIVCAPIWDLEGIAFIEESRFTLVTSLHTTASLALDSKPEWSSNRNFYKHHVKKVIAGETLMLKNTPFILSNSKAIVTALSTKDQINPNAANITIIPHGIEPITNNEYSKSKSIKSRSRVSDINILFVGRFEKRKGALLIIDTIKALARKNSSLNHRIHFDIVGAIDGTLVLPADRLSRRINNKKSSKVTVKFHGKVSDADLQEKMQSCDIFFAPSLFESFGLIYLEAMRFGCPIVTLENSAAIEVLAAECAVILPIRATGTSVAKELLRLSNDQKRRCEMGENARQRFDDHYQAETMIDSIEEYFSYIGQRKAEG